MQGFGGYSCLYFVFLECDKNKRTLRARKRKMIVHEEMSDEDDSHCEDFDDDLHDPSYEKSDSG